MRNNNNSYCKKNLEKEMIQIENCVNKSGDVIHRAEIPKIRGITEIYASDKFRYICGNLKSCNNKVKYKGRSYCKYQGEWIG